MDFADLIGQTLDEKYQMTRELGRGGMGTVYLATHLGTERPVAIKVIAPQYMQRPEFVERFRREARAAGRLRHPNVVDVTDFGFAPTPDGHVAYLVMEYLDGCTLGEILEEEKNLPVGWTLDILDQVCSAVQEAHDQGIIHRDLKPDNIWLEPNQRGGYTVKVLDFGIAKLETASSSESNERNGGNGLAMIGGRLTAAGLSNEETIHDSISPTLVSEAGTAMIDVRPDANGSEKKTAILQPVEDTDQETIGTRLISESVSDPSTPHTIRSTTFDSLPTKELTRVGAVLGTPLYMSPEQCRGERLDPRSDIYSLGVIAYQMLSGNTPFIGDFTEIMESHKVDPPPPLKAKKVRKKLRRAIFSALEKDADRRPQTAEAFATILRSRSEGIFGLLRRAGMIYTEHITKFLMLSAFFHIPMILLTAAMLTISILRATEQIAEGTATFVSVFTIPLLGIVTAFGAYLIIGTTTWIVAQSLAIPLRPIKLRSALRDAWRRWKSIALTGILTTVLQIVFGVITCGIGFVVTSVLWSLVGPVVMMENVRGWKAIKRSTTLVRRSLMTSIAAVLIMFLIPALVAGITSAAVNLSAKAIWNEVGKTELEKEGDKTSVAQFAENDGKDKRDINISLGSSPRVRIFNMEPDMQKRLRQAILETLLQILLLPLQIVMTSFTAIIVALLYLKTRQAGGESLQDLLSKFEETDQPRKKWQERVRQRLIQSGRITSKPTG
jgi:serine/threonine protein kinase